MGKKYLTPLPTLTKAEWYDLTQLWQRVQGANYGGARLMSRNVHFWYGKMS